MKNLKLVSLMLCLSLFTQASFAATGFKDLYQDYQYSMTVEWDQKDQSFREQAEKELSNGIETLLQNGHDPIELKNEILTMIPNSQERNEMAAAFNLFDKGELSQIEMMNLIQENSASMQTAGASFSPTKLVIGIVVGYAVLKGLMLVMMYWDTDPNYGSTDGNPPKP